MQKSEPNKASEIKSWFIDDITRLFAMYPNAKMSPATPIAWWGVLGGLTRDQLRFAISSAVQESPGFIPSAPTILLAAKAAKEDPGAKLDAWQQVMKAAQNSRSPYAGVLGGRAEEVVRQMGGIRRLGEMTEEELTVWGRKQFDSLWEEIGQRDELRKRLGYADESKMLGSGNVVDISAKLAEKFGMEKP